MKAAFPLGSVCGLIHLLDKAITVGGGFLANVVR
jgi:hypothetical protein